MRLSAVLLALALTGCVSAETFPSGRGVVYAPTDDKTILVYFSPDEVVRPYEVVATILTEGSSGWGKKDSDLARKAQKEAAKVGAHAIIITREKGAGSITAALFGTNDKVQRVQAIRFTESSVREIRKPEKR